jgi:hypothetical protein
MAFVFDECFLQLIVQLEVSSWQDLEERVPVVFEVEDIITGLVLDFDVCESLGCEVAGVVAVSLETLDDDALTVLEMRVVLVLGHKIYSNQ